MDILILISLVKGIIIIIYHNQSIKIVAQNVPTQISYLLIDTYLTSGHVKCKTLT